MSTRHRRVRRTAILAGLFVAVVAAPSAASAYWTTVGVGVGTAATGTLEAPTDVRARATGTDVTVTWTTPAQAFPAPTLGYEATDDRGATVCRAASPTATSCSYTASPGTSRYTVTAVLESWTATKIGRASCRE